MTRKVDSRDLRIGLYVDALDRPWVETDFPFQGFRIQNQEDLESLRRQTEYVFVDDEKSDELTPKESVLADRTSSQQSEKQLRQVEVEIRKAHTVHSLIETSLSSVMKDMRLGRAVRLDEVKDAIKEMIQSLMRNPDALLLLGRIEQADNAAASHAINCSIIALTFGRYMGLKGEELEAFGLAALLHDVGETEIPDELLDTTGPKTDEEIALIRRHTEFGRDILEKMNGIPPSVVDVVYSHHEQVDGKGYPRGLTGDNISLNAKMMSLVGVYEWCTSSVSGEMLTAPEASRFLYGQRDIMFDKDLTEKFIQCLGIYPVGCIVELVKGEVGVVISIPEDARLYPRLVLILDSDKQPYYPPRLINLSIFQSSENAEEYAVKKVLPRDAYGFDFKKYIQREMGLTTDAAKKASA